MGLRIIYGRAGTGKSEFCFKEISDKIQGKYKIYIITPEQFSFNAEERLLKTIKSNAVINAEVLTFKRMAYRISSEIGYKNKKLLSDSGKYMLLYDILEKNKGKLRFLGKSDKNIELVDTSITEFKKHNVNIEILNNVINKTENLYLKYKLEDIYLLYNEFQERIKNSYLEDNDLLTNLYEDLDKTNMFKNTIIYLDEFSGFTPQEYNIIKKLMKIAKQVNITICTDKFPEEIISDMDLFYSNKVTLQKIINLTQKEKINIEKPVYLNIKYRFKSPELLHIEDKLYEIPYKKYQNKCESLSLYLSTNPYTEIKYVANKIIELVKEKNYRYRDIAIITKNIESYASLTKAIFSQYEIPIFIDQKKDLNQNLLVKYILALLEVFNKNWSYEAMFQYIKIGLCDISDEECFRLENYCLKWGIKYSRWYKEDWKFEDDKIDEINRIRKLVVDPLLLFKKQLDGRKTYKEITEVIYNFLIQNKIGEKLINKAKELEKNNEIEISKEYIAGWDIVISVLKEIIQVFGNEQVSFEKYADRFKVGIKATGIGKIPVAMDQVTLGDIVLLSAGSMIPADLRVLQSKDVYVGQSSLTGEAESVRKLSFTQVTLDEIDNVSDLDTICFMGTNVISGSAKCAVIKTADSTYLGKVAKNITNNQSKSAFQKGIENISKLLIKFMFILTPIVFILNAWKHSPVTAFTFAVAIAICITPLLLPVILSSSLSKGAVKMSKKKTIVKKLDSIQSFGAMNILCTDKTRYFN